MAPNTYANAENSYRQAYNRLKVACTLLERHLPLPDDGSELETPSLTPRERVDRVAQCALCRAELETLEPEERAGHGCNHQGQASRQDDENRSVTASDEGRHGSEVHAAKRGVQPNAGVIKQDLTVLEDKFDAFIVALSILTSLMSDEDGSQYENLLLEWTEFCGWLKDRADQTIRVLQAGVWGEQLTMRPVDTSPALSTTDDTGSGKDTTTTLAGTSSERPGTSTVDHKRIMEVYEVIEAAQTQLQNLEAVQSLHDDFSLMSKLVLKLPVADQRQYTQYVTSPIVKATPGSRWDKFWGWMQQLNDAAVQASLMHMCEKPGGQKSNSKGATCNNCGGVGHFTRACTSKSRSTVTGASVKVNLAVARISTRDDYNKYLPETKKQLGKCPGCNQAPHSYSRQFPFGKADWPSNRLETCPQFMSKSPKDRGELLEKLKGCFKCTSWKNMGDACFIKSKSNCTVTAGGSACSGIHHKLLHGSGVAFCHKVTVVPKKAHSSRKKSSCTDKPPDMNQPVLLEIQSLEVHGNNAKVMFDNGSTAVLVTHSFAERAGLEGRMVAYWLIVVGHERVLRHTMLYSFFLEDLYGIKHEVNAYGIDQISEDSAIVDLDGVRSVFPGAPKEVYNRPAGAIDILIGSMYRNLQPYGGEDSFTQGRLRLVRSHFGCGFILTGTHPSITSKENTITEHAKSLSNGVQVALGDMIPTMSCNRALTNMKIPEFFEAEEMGVAPARACKRCRGCVDCSFRNAMISREKQAVVRRMEDQLNYDAESHKVSVSYPWNRDILKLTDNLGQAIKFQTSVERRLLKDPKMCEF